MDSQQNTSAAAPAGTPPPAAGQPSGNPDVNAMANPAAAGAMQGATSASLYCGNLHPDVTEAMLFEIFNQIGMVASIRVCRDAATRRSLGYAYINFHNVPEAERAMDQLNYSSIKGRAIRLMWSQRDPSLRKSGVGNIFIKNLEKNIDNKSLHDTFSSFGNILSCKVVTDEGGNSLGYGFVHYERKQDAEEAIKTLNGMLLNGKVVYVGPHIPKRDRMSKAEELRRNFTNVYVKNMDPSVDSEGLYKLFEEFGPIVSHVVMTGEDGQSRCFGFVNFQNHEDAVKAVEEMDGKEVNGKKLYVSRAQKKSERREELKHRYDLRRQEQMNKYQGVNLYIKNLPEGIDDAKLHSMFSKFGNITSTKVAVDENRNSKGFGFVCYSSPDEATKAVTAMNGEMVEGKPLYVALAQRKEVRRQQLEAQYAQRAQLRMAQAPGMIPGQVYPNMFFNPMMGAGTARGFPMYPGQMMRPRWNPQQQPGRPYGFPYGAAQMQPRPNRRGPRQTGVPPTSRPPTNGVAAVPIAGQRSRPGYQKWQNPPMRNPRGDMPPGPADALDPSALASASPDHQKRILADRIFLMIQRHQPEYAGKITGMLLDDMDTSELLHLIDTPQSLYAKMDDAMVALKKHEAVGGGAPVEAGAK